MNKKFYISSLDIFDLLMAKEKKFSSRTMTEIAKSRGIFLSDEDDRETLAGYISRLPFDYSGIEELYSAIESDNRREKTTSARLPMATEYSKLFECVEKVNELRSPLGEKIRIVSEPSSKNCSIEIEYEDRDYAKARMLQSTTRIDNIDFIADRKGTTIRHPANEKSEQLLELIISEMKKLDPEVKDLKRIDLSHIPLASTRNSFFVTLMDSIPDMTREDVVNVKISRFLTDVDKKYDVAAEEVEAGDYVPGFIRKVTLEGNSLTSQAEYSEFIRKGFFLSSVTWKSKGLEAGNSILAEFEAGFTNQTECKEFKYSLKSLYSWEKSGDELVPQRVHINEGHKLKYLRLLENAAAAAFEGISHE